MSISGNLVLIRALYVSGGLIFAGNCRRPHTSSKLLQFEVLQYMEDIFKVIVVQSDMHAGVSDYDASYAHPYIHIYRRRHSRNRPGRALGATRLRRAAPSSSVVPSSPQRVDRPVESEEANREYANAVEAPPTPKRPPYEPTAVIPVVRGPLSRPITVLYVLDPL